MTRDDEEKVRATGDALRATFAPPTTDDPFAALLAALDASIIDAAAKVISDR